MPGPHSSGGTRRCPKVVSLEIIISPAGRLSAEPAPDAAPPLDDGPARRIAAAFATRSAEGLLRLLAPDLVALPLPPSLAYWREFARRYLQRLCQAGADPAAPAPVVSIEPAEVAELILQAPPMRGGAEFLTPPVLAALWWDLGALIQRETTAEGFAAWLKSHHPQWHTVGRVTFHLAENKRDDQRPFAFLATYTHRLSDQGKAQHLPLARALQEYAGAQHKAALANLLAPVQRASETSGVRA